LPDGRVEIEMLMPTVGPAAKAIHEFVGTDVVYRDGAYANNSKGGRASLARFAWFVVAYNVAAIVWGAYVRATGSGGGCGTHWPLCNGEVLPKAPQAQTMIEFSHRVSSGVSLALVALLLVWCWRRTAKGDWPRRSAIAAAVLLLNEAVLGAFLVLINHLGGLGQSATHALFLCLHFGNTLCLLAALTLTASWLSSTYPRPAFLRKPYQMTATALGLLSAMIIGITGSLASLGDTLFSANSLPQALLQDFSSSSPILLRVRALHPIAAVIGSLFLLWLFRVFRRKQEPSAWLSLLPFTLAVQIALGVLNVSLLAPICLQMTHLLVAELFWILLVLASADQMRPVPIGGTS
jgi:Uncharacterized protein required for cytochrome oxidase assembly